MFACNALKRAQNQAAFDVLVRDRSETCILSVTENVTGCIILGLGEGAEGLG